MDFSSERLIPAPWDPADWPAWREALGRWRLEARQALGHDGSTYDRPEFAWVGSCFSCCLAMLYDELLYDAGEGRFTPERFLEHGRREFGGFDAVVLWHAYPMIGLDGRNQFDYYRDAPGGFEGLRALADALRTGGVRVFLDYNPWDTGTRREPDGDSAALAATVAAMGADGVFLDTMRQGSSELRERLDAARPGVALESESTLPLERVHDHQMSWAQWYADSEAPGVLRNRWFERRHMMHHTRRWERDHWEELHSAWMNGAGVLVWENVFGAPNPWNARDRSILRAMLPVQRRFAHLFRGEGWVPLVPTRHPRVHASSWHGNGERLWTLVNRSPEPVGGVLLELELGPGEVVFDPGSGEEVKVRRRGPRAEISLELLGRGVGALLALERNDPRAGDFLEERPSGRVPFEADASPPAWPVRLRPAPRTAPAPGPPPGMAAVAAWEGELRTVFRRRECGTYGGAPFVDEWKPKYPRLHDEVVETRTVRLSPYAIGLREVTNREYLEFVEVSGYQPAHPERFLDHWADGQPRPGEEDEPVVFVDLDDARAYARRAGRRLPTEEEWQHALQTLELPVSGPRVWNWTESERSDGRTRFAILKHGADHLSPGSEWYFDGGPRPPEFAAKLLLAWPGLDRRETVGFRCAVDLKR